MFLDLHLPLGREIARSLMKTLGTGVSGTVSQHLHFVDPHLVVPPLVMPSDIFLLTVSSSRGNVFLLY